MVDLIRRAPSFRRPHRSVAVMKHVIHTLLLAALLTAPCAAQAQAPASTPAAAPAATYDSLTLRKQSLLRQESELADQLAETRRLYAADDYAGREALGNTIVRLESDLYAVRDALEALEDALAEVERELPVRPAVPETPATAEQGHALLTDNGYFRNNLPAEEYGLLEQAQSREAEAARMARTISENYRQLDALLQAYNALSTRTPQADSLYAEALTLADRNDRLAADLAAVWSEIFDAKTYAYNYVLDKCGAYDALAVQEQQMNDLRLLDAETRDDYMYADLVRYALQKQLLLGYERRLADLAALGEAADSLAGVPLPTEHIADFFLPPLDTREKMFYDLADATPVRPARYANVRQIPQVQIFPRGTIYRILLGAYSQPPAVSVFRSVAPLSQETKADRRTYYYAGGYASYEEAQAAAARLKKLGFRNPRIVAWQDGTYDAEPGATTTPKPGTPGKNQPEYRVEIRNASAEGLSRMVRDVIATRATGKEISRISDSATGEPVFVVGTFSNRTLAETVVGAIQEADPSLDVSLVTIP